MLKRGKRIAVLTLVAGVVVATIGGWLAYPRIVEEWYLLRLDSDDDAVRLDAANRLAERRSLRAIPRPSTASAQLPKVDRRSVEQASQPILDAPSGQLCVG